MAEKGASEGRSRGITVVLDANAIISDYRLSTAAAIALLSNSTIGTVAVGVPEVALEEAVNKFREEATKAVGDIDRHLQVLKRLGVEADLNIKSVDELCASYETAVKARLRKWGVTVLRYPAVSHGELGRRAVAKRTPFDQQGRGYRDALVWHTVVELVGSRDVWLISADNDFRTSGSEDLAPTLVDDIKTAHRQAADVRLFRSIKDCVNALGETIVQPKADITKRLRDDAGYLNRVQAAMEAGLMYKPIDPADLTLPSALADEASIDGIDVADVYVSEARLTSTGELLVRIDSIVEVELELLIDKTEV